MLVYHGTFNNPSPDIKPKFVSPSFKFAHWFASVAVDKGEPFWVVEFQLSRIHTIIDVSTIWDVQKQNSSWQEIEKKEETIKCFAIALNKSPVGVWMTENKEPTILLFEPEKSLQFVGIEKFIL